MKLTKSELANIKRVCEICKTAGIVQVIIEPNKIRGAHESRMSVIFQDKDVEFSQTYGIGDVTSLINRMMLLDDSRTTAEIQLDDTSSFVRNIQFDDGNVQVGFRFTRPELIRAPKQLRDTEIVVDTELSTTNISTLINGMRAMSTDNFSIVTTESGTVSLQIRDISGEMLTVKIDEVSPVATKLVHSYSKDTLSIISNADDGRIQLTERGLMYITISGITLALVPYVPEE